MAPVARGTSRGFTLLEVLVAIAILGLGLTMILSSQVGLFSGASRGQHFTIATNLARCKMSEVELDLLKKGYPLTDEKDEGSCCGEDGEPGYTCAWKVERIELPEATEMNLDGGTDPSDPTQGPFAALEKLGVMPGADGKQAPTPAGPGALQDIAQSVGASSMGSGIGPMVMGMVYPSLKPMLEASIRKLTVQVEWKEGSKKKEFVVTQYVTDPQQGQLDGDAGVMAGDTSTMTGVNTGISTGVNTGTNVNSTTTKRGLFGGGR
ncbi:MAG TPA: type II secretion system protein [Polyangiaceae bacterium]|nr:type II secretion system protein [Polyangiaceae bacterium]